jgi:hypothetical protein
MHESAFKAPMSKTGTRLRAKVAIPGVSHSIIVRMGVIIVPLAYPSFPFTPCAANSEGSRFKIELTDYR